MKHTIHTSCTTHSFGLFKRLAFLLVISTFFNIGWTKAETATHLSTSETKEELLTNFYNLDSHKFYSNSHEHFDDVILLGSVDDHSHVTSASGTPMNTTSVIAAEDSADVKSAESSLFLSVSCNDMVNVSLDGNCEALITPDMILEGAYADLTDFSVNVLLNNGTSIGNTVTGAQIGQTLTVEVTEISTGNYCWGSILVEDKMPPTIDCTPAIVTIQCYEALSTVPEPTALDNCDNTIEVTLINEVSVENGCNNPNDFITTITRTYTAIDASGNEAAMPCTQVINIQKADIDDIIFPVNVDGANALNCASNNINVDPTQTGWPTINGLPIQEINSCTFAVNYTDATLNGCGGSYAIIRTWSVMDWCGNPGGANPRTATQTIKVKDLDGPTISCPPSATISVNTQDCTASTIFPEATIFDECSEFTVQTLYPGGILESNGGLALDIAIGTYDVIYRATDACGNISECTMELIVEDAQAPIAVCDQITTVSLNSAGVGNLNVASLDDGSYDSCTAVTFDGRKMTDPANVYATTVQFDCSEVAQTIMVEMRVSDANGNTNTCMVEVNIEDKLPPVVSCPADITLDCMADFTDLSITGTASNIENCPTIFFIGHEDVSNSVNNCGEGVIIRRFKIIDGAGMADSCDQMITIEDMDLFDANDIIWPADYTASDCTSASELTPALLPSGFNEPTWNDNGCDLIAVNYEDQLFNVADSACFKIVRHWTILDWCQYDQANPSAGFFEHSQVIKVIDNTPPEFETCIGDLFVKIQGPICDSTVYIPRLAVTDCSQDTVITVFTEGLGEGYGPFFNVPLGDYNVVYTATDGCGNVSVCNSVLHVEDGTNPTVYCKNGVIFEMGEEGIVELWASDVDNGSFDNCSDVSLHFVQNDLSSNVIFFDCSQVGEVTIPLYVTDASFNQDFCLVTLIIQDNMNVCDPDDDPLFEVTGFITNENDESIESVNMAVSGYMEEEMMSTIEGAYGFELEAQADYTVAPSLDDNILNGVTTYDLVLMSKHILGVAPLDSPYKIIAADINNSGAVTTADMVALRRVILLIDSEFANNTSWRFVDAAYEFPMPSNPFYEFYPEVYSINNLAGEMTDIDFVGVKIGDINGSATTNGSMGMDERSLPSKVFHIEDRALKLGAVELIEISTKDLAQLEGFQLELALDPTKVDILDIETNILTVENVGLSKISEGTILLSWNNKAMLSTDESLLSIKVMVNESTSIKEITRLTNKHITNEVYGTDGERFNAQLSFDGNDTNFQYSNSPNPFQNQTSIWLELTHTEMVELTLYDFSGKIIKQTQELRNRGLNEWMITRKDLGTNGVYFYTMRINDTTLNGKMIMLD